MKRAQRIILRDKTGFRNINGNPIVIYDKRGVIFYDTRDLENIVWEFNLPAGEYYLERGKISEMMEPVQYELMPMPKPERNRRGDPTLFRIEFTENKYKCTVDWKARKIIFDNQFKNAPLPAVMFILYHEHAHKHYETEAICDRYAANKMLDAGYNPSQIGESVLTLSDKNFPRKEYLINSLINHYDESINDNADAITADSVPVLDGWGWGDYWSADNWMEWHKRLVEKYGLQKANEKFITAYHKAGIGAASYDWRTFNRAFINYAKANGFYQALFEGVGGLIGQVASATYGAVSGAADLAAGAGELAKTVSKFLPAILIGAAVLAFLIYKPRTA